MKNYPHKLGDARSTSGGLVGVSSSFQISDLFLLSNLFRISDFGFRISARTASILIALVITASGGCGYSRNGNDPSGSYQWRSLYREDIRTVAVPIFENKDFRRGVEFSLTKAVVNQLESRTPYKVAAREGADTVLEGEIVSVRLAVLSNDENTAIPQEQLYVLTVNFTWKDMRTGKILVERKNFEQTTAFYPTLGEGEFVGSQQAVEKLALGIVQELQADW